MKWGVLDPIKPVGDRQHVCTDRAPLVYISPQAIGTCSVLCRQPVEIWMSLVWAVAWASVYFHFLKILISFSLQQIIIIFLLKVFYSFDL